MNLDIGIRHLRTYFGASGAAFIIRTGVLSGLIALVGTAVAAWAPTFWWVFKGTQELPFTYIALQAINAFTAVLTLGMFVFSLYLAARLRKQAREILARDQEAVDGLMDTRQLLASGQSYADQTLAVLEEAKSIYERLKDEASTAAIGDLQSTIRKNHTAVAGALTELDGSVAKLTERGKRLRAKAKLRGPTST